jgi:hypothetical protein
VTSFTSVQGMIPRPVESKRVSRREVRGLREGDGGYERQERVDIRRMRVGLDTSEGDEMPGTTAQKEGGRSQGGEAAARKRGN